MCTGLTFTATCSFASNGEAADQQREMSAEMSDAEEQCERGIEADADAADDADPAGGAPASGTTGPHDAQPQASLLANEAAAADDTAAAADAPAAADEGAAAPSAATALNLQSAADCEAFLRTLPGGEVALEQAAAVTASLNARHDVLHQEELTYLLQVCIVDYRGMARDM